MGDKLEKIKSKSKWSLELSYSNDVRDFKIRVDFSSYERMTEIMKLAIIFNYIMMKKYPAERDNEITYWFQNDQLISHASINIINKNISKPFIDRLEVGIENIRKINKLEW